MRVTNSMPLGRPQSLTVVAMNCVETLKGVSKDADAMCNLLVADDAKKVAPPAEAATDELPEYDNNEAGGADSELYGVRFRREAILHCEESRRML
jgi:hypothetical protein